MNSSRPRYVLRDSTSCWRALRPAARPTTAVIRKRGALRPLRLNSKPHGEPLELNWAKAI